MDAPDILMSIAERPEITHCADPRFWMGYRVLSSGNALPFQMRRAGE
jgi:hypothetical protein